MTLKKPIAILFDWDGTLVDSLSLICVSMANTFKKANLPTPDDLNRQIHTPDFMKKHFPESQYHDLRKMYREHYNELAKEGLQTLPHAEQSLEMLKSLKVKMAVVSNKLADFLLMEVKRVKWEHYFETIVGSGTTPEDKPSPLPAFHALKDLNINASEDVWFFGDTVTDMTTAYNSGCLPVFFGEDDPSSEYYKHCRPKVHFRNHKELVECLHGFK